MGRGLRVAASALAIASAAAGLWPVSIVCALYLAASLGPGRPGSLSRRAIAALVLLAFSGVALLSGGSISPVALLAAGALLLLWPSVRSRVPPSEAVAVEDSILLRSKVFPFFWGALAEVKAGPESFPRALSSFAGTLLLFTGSGRAYAFATCFSAGREGAEAKLLSRFRLPLHGAYLLPLDSAAASDALSLKLSPVRLPRGDAADAVRLAPGLLVVGCERGAATRLSCFDVLSAAPSPAMPSPGAPLRPPPLLWEVLDTISKKTRWPGPDSWSSLLESMASTPGAPLAERLRYLEGSEGEVKVESLAGGPVVLTRAQLRAILRVYP